MDIGLSVKNAHIIYAIKGIVYIPMYNSTYKHLVRLTMQSLTTCYMLQQQRASYVLIRLYEHF